MFVPLLKSRKYLINLQQHLEKKGTGTAKEFKITNRYIVFQILPRACFSFESGQVSKEHSLRFVSCIYLREWTVKGSFFFH
ncbi:hypothetical protein Barb6XT_00495 [Bacteroidales bacterium Barb6XT]|nr:hypothetical protein Barb6XT_00495 [Bacteroidales bacterium Barb6XT]